MYYASAQLANDGTHPLGGLHFEEGYVSAHVHFAHLTYPHIRVQCYLNSTSMPFTPPYKGTEGLRLFYVKESIAQANSLKCKI